MYALLRVVAAIPAIPEQFRATMALADMIRAGTGLLLTSAAWPVLRRWIDPVSARGWSLAGLGAVGLSFLWMVCDRAVLVTFAAATHIVVPWEYFQHGVDLGYGLVLTAWTMAVLFMLLLQRESHLRESLLAQEAATQAARLVALSNRLHPHFLFNSLNTIRSFAAEDPTRTREMLTRLSTFLRHALSVDPTTAATLSAELDSIESYLWIEQARFEPKLVVEYDVEARARSCAVPPLLLQPLVENAVLHGDAGADGLHRIRVRATMREHTLCLSVSNTGGLHVPPVEGVGLSLTRARMQQMFGAAQRVTLSVDDGWFTMAIEIDHAGTGRS